jgi:hypothetical protein
MAVKNIVQDVVAFGQRMMELHWQNNDFAPPKQGENVVAASYLPKIFS